MNKVIFTVLLLAFSTATFAVDNDGTNGMSGENIFCQLFKITCKKANDDGIGQKADHEGVGGKSRDHANDRGIPPDTQSTRSSGAVGSASRVSIRGAT